MSCNGPGGIGPTPTCPSTRKMVPLALTFTSSPTNRTCALPDFYTLSQLPAYEWSSNPDNVNANYLQIMVTVPQGNPCSGQYPTTYTGGSAQLDANGRLLVEVPTNAQTVVVSIIYKEKCKSCILGRGTTRIKWNYGQNQPSSGTAPVFFLNVPAVAMEAGPNC